jgi:hypothetical protein
MDEGRAREKLMRRYIHAFGPVTPMDAAWWIGLTKTESKRTLAQLAESTEQITVEDLEGDLILTRDQVARLSSVKPMGRTVNLLPAQDSYVMGYKDRERYLDPRDKDLVFDRSGNATSTILLDGRVIGVWDIDGGKNPVAKLMVFEDVDEQMRREIRLRLGALGQFMAGGRIPIRESESMTPLPERTAGGFMSPLRDLDR